VVSLFNKPQKWFDEIALQNAIVMLGELEEVSLQSHYQCEDTYYNCPARKGGECDCGADEHNENVRSLVAAIGGELKGVQNGTR